MSGVPGFLKALSPLAAIIDAARGGDKKDNQRSKTPSFAHGGKMKKSGRAKVHKGERIMGKKPRGRSSGR